MSDALTLVTHSADETRTVGSVLGKAAQPGDLFLLEGDIGTGKTTLVQGLASGLGYAGEVTSPTFTLVHEYAGGRITLVHVDLYRIERASQLRDLDLDDYMRAGAVLAVEWPELLRAWYPKACTVRLHYGDDTARQIVIENAPSAVRGDLHRLFSKMEEGA